MDLRQQFGAVFLAALLQCIERQLKRADFDHQVVALADQVEIKANGGHGSSSGYTGDEARLVPRHQDEHRLHRNRHEAASFLTLRVTG